MSLSSRRLEEAVAAGPPSTHLSLVIGNAMFISQRLKKDPAVLALPKLVLSSKYMEKAPFKNKGDILELGPIHIVYLYEALQWLSESTRAKVAVLELYENSIGDEDVPMLLDIVALFPNLKELDLGYCHFNTPKVAGMHSLLDSLALVRMEGTHLSSFFGAYLFDSLDVEQIKKFIFLTLPEFESEIFLSFVPEHLEEVVLATHEAFYTGKLLHPWVLKELAATSGTCAEAKATAHSGPSAEATADSEPGAESAAEPIPAEPTSAGPTSAGPTSGIAQSLASTCTIAAPTTPTATTPAARPSAHEPVSPPESCVASEGSPDSSGSPHGSTDSGEASRDEAAASPRMQQQRPLVLDQKLATALDL